MMNTDNLLLMVNTLYALVLWAVAVVPFWIAIEKRRAGRNGNLRWLCAWGWMSVAWAIGFTYSVVMPQVIPGAAWLVTDAPMLLMRALLLGVVAKSAYVLIVERKQ